MIRAVLLDIEGTTTSVAFVYDTLFPYARREMENYLARHWSEPAVCAACELIAHDAGHADLAAWFGTREPEEQRRAMVQHLLALMDRDAKLSGLKALQGLIWADGYASGELKGHVYDDVPPALQRWRVEGVPVYIYSSGSIAAQRLLFGHSDHGDLLPFIAGHFDTTTGPKRVAESYRKIAEAIHQPATSILFCSDVREELDAAQSAGMQTRLLLRPGNAPLDLACPHRTADNFDAL